MADKRDYARGTYLLTTQPWGTFVGGAAVCPDGKVRRLKRIAITADSFFSIPAAVCFRGKTVSGFVTFSNPDGTSTTGPDTYVEFIPVQGRKNSRAFRRFGVVEYQSGYEVTDDWTGRSHWLGDGVDMLFDAEGEPLVPGTEHFLEALDAQMNADPEETLAAYFPEPQ
jgi:hypothetical protein